MIESVDMVVMALSAGVAAGVSNAATSAVTDAYAELKSLAASALRRRAQAADETGDADAEDWLTDPGNHREELIEALSAAGTDEALLNAARKVLALTDPVGESAGKYRIGQIRDNTSVVVGDNASLTQHIGKQ